MPFEVTSLPLPAKSASPHSMTTLVQNLRRYSKSSIISIGTAMLWDAYRNRADRPRLDEHYQILNAYGPKIILLGMATANNHRDKHLTQHEFYALCHDYLGIRNTISSQQFLKNEAEQLLGCLKAQQKDKIPEEYLSLEHLRAGCAELFIARSVRAQHTSHHTVIEELHSLYHIFSMLDKATAGAATMACHKAFGVEPLHFLRSAFGLYALGNDPGRNGYINFKGMGWGQDVIDLWGIDKETCRTVASKIAYDESRLRDEWYVNTVLALHELYQQHAPDPLYKHPIIHLNGTEAHMQFLMPSPAIFLRSLTNAWFSQLIAEDKTLGNKLGDVLENHIRQSLEHIFGKEHVTKIPEEKGKKTADFHIALDECDLVIEVKVSLGSDAAQSLMKPEHVADIWSRSYGACAQCAASIQQYKKAERPIIAVVLAGDHITAEVAPFQSFAERSGLFKNFGIDAIEFLSWNAVEYSLSHTSVSKFAQRLVDKWKKGERMQLRDVMSLDIERDTPAHSYEYLRDAELQIFGKRFPDTK